MLWTCRTYLRGAKGGTTGRSMESGVPNRNIANFQKVGLFLYGLCVDPDYSFTGDHARGRRRRPGALLHARTAERLARRDRAAPTFAVGSSGPGVEPGGPQLASQSPSTNTISMRVRGALLRVGERDPAWLTAEI